MPWPLVIRALLAPSLHPEAVACRSMASGGLRVGFEPASIRQTYVKAAIRGMSVWVVLGRTPFL
jgi:hypothetical protein